MPLEDEFCHFFKCLVAFDVRSVSEANLLPTQAASEDLRGLDHSLAELLLAHASGYQKHYQRSSRSTRQAAAVLAAVFRTMLVG